MASLTHFAFYPKDYLGDLNVREASYESQGVYVALLALMWQAADGACSLPLDDEKVARLLRLDARSWRRIKPKVWHLFQVDLEAGVFFHGRLRHEHDRALRLHDRAKKAEEGRRAKREASANSGQSSPQSPANLPPNLPGNSDGRFVANSAEKHEVGPKQALTTQTQTQTHTTTKKQRTPSPPARTERRTYEPRFAAFWEAFPGKRGSKADAADLHAEWVGSGESPDALETAAKNYATECEILGTELRFTMHATRFLARKGQVWLSYAEGWAPPKPKGRAPVVNQDYRDSRALAGFPIDAPAKQSPPASGAYLLPPMDKSEYRRTRFP